VFEKIACAKAEPASDTDGTNGPSENSLSESLRCNRQQLGGRVHIQEVRRSRPRVVDLGAQRLDLSAELIDNGRELGQLGEVVQQTAARWVDSKGKAVTASRLISAEPRNHRSQRHRTTISSSSSRELSGGGH
jgi:hypothetical protein